MRTGLRGLALLAAVWSGPLPAAEPEARHQRPALREPAALVLADHDSRLLAANRRTGTISVVDTAGPRVVAEVPIGQGLADLKRLGDGRLLAIDESAGALLLLRLDGDTPRIVHRVRTKMSPVSVELSADQRLAFVACLWPRMVQIVELPGPEDPAPPAIVQTLELPFAPRGQQWLPRENRLVVADNFGGRLAIVRVDPPQVETLRELPAHNIRGLGVSPDGRKLLVSHQILNGLAETSHNDVHWGILMTNVLRWLHIEHVLNPQTEILRDSHVLPPGDTATAGGDPAGLAVTAEGTVVLALAGVDQVALGQETDYTLPRVAVGRRPTAVVASADGRLAYVSNSLDDTLCVIDVGQRRVRHTLALGPRPELTPAEQGQRLFYDARLALDGWFSCHSCHTDGHTNSLLNDNLGDGSFGAAKRVLPLGAVTQTAPWAWNGAAGDLAEQIRKSIRTTMQGRNPDEQQVEALAAYLQTLAPPPALDVARGTVNRQLVNRGNQVFQARGCNHCHAPPWYTSVATYDVGIHDRLGQRRFNPPSLLGVSQRDALFHDNRAASLEEVLTKHRHQLDQPLGPDELQALLAFLRSL